MRKIYTEDVPSGIVKVYEREIDALANKLHNMCRMMIKGLAAGPLARIKFGKITMGMGTYHIEGKLSYLDEDGDDCQIEIHDLATISETVWCDYGITDEEKEQLKLFFGTLDFWLEVNGGQDMDLCSD